MKVKVVTVFIKIDKSGEPIEGARPRINVKDFEEPLSTVSIEDLFERAKSMKKDDEYIHRIAMWTPPPGHTDWIEADEEEEAAFDAHYRRMKEDQSRN